MAREPAAKPAPDSVVLIGALALLQLLTFASVQLGYAGLLIEVSYADLLVITFLIAGWAAWMTGRAIASTWRPYWHVVAYMIPFALVVRWVHFALFKGTMFSLHYFLVDLFVVLALATLGYRQVRVAQMTTQYRWLYERTGLFGWRRKEEGA
jgi:ABC-type polysaccharide/polyol phosphate export permease